MKKKEIIVETLMQLRQAMENECSETIIVKGMIDCSGFALWLEPRQKLIGYNRHSGLIFRFVEQARTVFTLRECCGLENLKIRVIARKYPNKEAMQGAIVANGYRSYLKNVFLDICITDTKVESCKQYSGLYIRNELHFIERIHIRSKGHYVVPIADFPLSSSRIVGESTRLILEGGRFAAGFFLDLSGDKNVIQIKGAAAE